MPPPEIVPFADEHLDAAAELLAARHRRHRATEPLLPEHFEDAAAARAEVARVWAGGGASGAAAFARGRMVGYLIGAPRENDVWGDNVWVELAGHAVADADVARDLYAVAGGLWVAAEKTRHYVLVPGSDAALSSSWFDLSFGKQQVHALRELPAANAVEPPDGFEIRAPREDEIELLVELDLALPEHHRNAPIFSTVAPPSREAARAEWRSTLAGNDETVLIGAKDGTPVACWSLLPLELEGAEVAMMAPADACFLHFAVTLPAWRGAGIGTALTQAAFAWAREAGYRTIVTDWRAANVPASRFWPRHGFRTSFVRLYRHIP